MVWVALGVLWAGQAWLTGRVAAGHDLDRVLWTVLGAVFPLAALLAVQLRFTRPEAGSVPSDVAASLRSSRVAAALATADDGLTVDEIAERSRVDADRVRAELGSLRLLGLARQSKGAWSLRPHAAAVVRDGEQR